ncbi:YgeY family selenium metabolism-linked hydrolase [Klebsiella indica]|uniref:YgeY family selenium metabolism-linked hydrolase n=1 Tax=Klebsiella indica TaxID=2582917 RepID=A0A5R9LPQ5_9ENTR|nr:YgeY family selenium metabolism-linked hydrolase [Klebsiella indica]TLV21991.1 YgeY family selenium metabolism-linked hydrolase [Klebsiella indica]
MNQQRQNTVITCCQRLIQKQSYSGQEKVVVDEIHTIMTELGYDEITIDRYGNIIGMMKGHLPGRHILFDGHIDTVPVNAAQWQYSPYSAEIIDDKIYGRGTSDMKGAVAAMLTAISNFAHDSNRQFAGNLYVSCVVHEECFEGVASRLISQNVKPDVVIIGEASELNLKIGQRGRAEILLETFGKPAHSANPETGINAVYSMATLLNALQKLPVEQHPQLGKGILEVTDIKSSPWPGASVVPDYCRATADRRLLTGETPASVLAPLQMLLDQCAEHNPHFKAKVSFAEGEETCWTGEQIQAMRFFPGWIMDEASPLVQTALTALRESGLTPEVTTYSFCTNGSHYAGEANIPTLGFGPSRENLAHVIDEYIEVKQLLGASQGYYALAKALTKSES